MDEEVIDLKAQDVVKNSEILSLRNRVDELNSLLEQREVRIQELEAENWKLNEQHNQ